MLLFVVESSRAVVIHECGMLIDTRPQKMWREQTRRKRNNISRVKSYDSCPLARKKCHLNAAKL